MKSLEVILKVAERCNINCTYCYFFNAGDNSYLDHSKTISKETIIDLIAFLNTGIEELSIEKIAIDFHGGEPLLLDKYKFDVYCTLLRNELKVNTIEFRLQTNAMLIDDDWIKLFSKHNIHVSTSIDGTKENHDKYRIDFKGRGTYLKTIQGLQKLQKAAKEGLISKPGVITVINPDIDVEVIYNHFVHELKLEVLEFLLPDFHYNMLDEKFDSIKYGNYLSKLYKIWFKEDNANIQIRVLSSITSLLLGGSSFVAGYGTVIPNVITISSNGHIGPDDTIRVCGKEYIDYSKNISTCSLTNYYNSEVFKHYIEAIGRNSETCQNCCWFNVCGGGHPVHKFNNGSFNNPSIYCEGLKQFYTCAASELIRKGLNVQTIIDNIITKGKSSANKSIAVNPIP